MRHTQKAGTYVEQISYPSCVLHELVGHVRRGTLLSKSWSKLVKVGQNWPIFEQRCFWSRLLRWPRPSTIKCLPKCDPFLRPIWPTLTNILFRVYGALEFLYSRVGSLITVQLHYVKCKRRHCLTCNSFLANIAYYRQKWNIGTALLYTHPNSADELIKPVELCIRK